MRVHVYVVTHEGGGERLAEAFTDERKADACERRYTRFAENVGGYVDRYHFWLKVPEAKGRAKR